MSRGTVDTMAETPPPKAVGPDGNILLPGPSGADPLQQILAAGDQERIQVSRRVKIFAVVAVALLLGALTVGIGATGAGDAATLRPQARQSDQSARGLAEYAQLLDSGRGMFPPSATTDNIVATETGVGLWRVTSRSLDGRCWQVLASTSTDDAFRLLSIETVPYQVEPIHCRFNQ